MNSSCHNPNGVRSYPPETTVSLGPLLRRQTVYGYRHGFAIDALARGVPDATVAALLGHADTSMLHRHYGHLTSRTQALKDAVGKVR